MSVFITILGSLFILAGLILMIIGSFGLLRFPDFFTRTHAASKVDTVGIVVVLFGIALIGADLFVSTKVVIVMLLIMFTNPVSVHMLARAALRSGLKPWKREAGNPLKENKEN